MSSSNTKISTQSEINELASEVMDLWQEHLAVYASDPKAKAELMRLLEPQRRLFADWASMMQNGVHAATTQAPSNFQHGASASTAGAAPAATASDDGALRVAQLAHRLAELEKRLDRVESALNAPAAKTQRRPKPSQH